MKKILYVLITCIFILSFVVSGTVQASAAGQTKSTTGNTTKTETTTSSKNDEKKSDGEIELYRKYESLISMLEKGDFQGAFSYINNLQNNANEKADDAPIMDIIVGTYIDLEDGFKVTFNPDYTVEYEDSSEMFEIKNPAVTLKEIDANMDFDIFLTPDGRNGENEHFIYNSTLNAYTFEFIDNGRRRELVKEDSIEEVEITSENWEDYFELGERLGVTTDAFGDITGSYIWKILKLKDDIKMYKGDTVVKFSYVEREYNVLSFDPEKRTFELGEETSKSKNQSHASYEVTADLSDVYRDEEFLYFGCDVCDQTWRQIDEDKMTVLLQDDIEIVKIKGTLYLASEQKKEATGGIEDYLVTVDLNSENFEDYFEFVTVPRYNAFGELLGSFGIGLKSKKYDEGLIIYTIDDITVEFADSRWTSDDSLDSLLSFSLTLSGYTADEIAYSGRITEGKVTYIKQEYVDSYDIPELEKPDDYNVYTQIQLQNGETLYRALYPDYPY